MADSGIVVADQQESQAPAPAPAEVPETNQNADGAPEEIDPAALKKLKIKAGVVKRLFKDKLSYQKEIIEQEIKIEAFVAEGKDESFMRQQTNCLNESKMMIPNVQKRLLAAYLELKEALDAEQSSAIGKTKEYKEASDVLEEAKVSAFEK